jgi:1,4-dihydroxy-2-naphthoate octaprenyltransferase
MAVCIVNERTNKVTIKRNHGGGSVNDENDTYDDEYGLDNDDHDEYTKRRVVSILNKYNTVQYTTLLLIDPFYAATLGLASPAGFSPCSVVAGC